MSPLEAQEWWVVLGDDDIMVQRVLYKSYSEASQAGLERTEQTYIKRRADELRSLGLNPESTEHWRLDTETLEEIRRQAESVKWLGHADGTDSQINWARANYELRQIVSVATGHDYMQ